MNGSETKATGVISGRLARWRLARRRSKLSRNRRPLSRATLVLVASLVVLFGLVVAAFAFLSPTRSGRQASLDQVLALASQHRIATATFLDEDASLNVVVAARPGPAATGAPLPAPATTPSSAAAPALPLGVATRLWVAYPKDNSLTSQLITDLTTGGARVRVDPQSTKAAVRLLLTVLLPLMILANLFALFFTAGRGGGTLGDVVSFGRISRKRFSRRQGQLTTFADVAGLEEAIVELGEVVDYLRSPQRYQEMAAAPPKGVLLFGPPGCGKTLLARAVAGEAEVPFFSVAGAEFVEALVGVGAARVRDLFARVRQVAPAIVFIDELDAAGRRRSAEGTGGSEERDQTLNQLLVEMDGFEVASGIVVMAATNRTDILDPALLRPGRFDRHMIIERPDLERREAILRLHASRRPTAPDIDFGVLARLTPGFSGADLANVINEAALLTLRSGGQVVGWGPLSEAVQRVMSGPQRRGHLLTAEERQRLASHEAGHALVASLTGREVHRVSIVARRGGLGAVGLDGREDEVVASRSQLLSLLVTQLAGRAAEELLLGEASTGAEDDIEAASGLASDLAGRWGMVDEIGVVRLLLPDRDASLDGAARLGPLAPDTHARFDHAVRRLMETALVDAARLLEVHRSALDALVTCLLDEETLEGARLAELLPGLDPLLWPPTTMAGSGAVQPATAASPSRSKVVTAGLG